MMGEHHKGLLYVVVAAALMGLIGGGMLAVLDVSAEAEPSRIERQLAGALLELKLRASRTARNSPLMPTMQDLERGADIYQEQCAFCHGAARGKPARFAKAFSPRPPQFVIEPAHGPTWMDAYLIQHGVRWSGMPAFHGLSEPDAWRVALYVEGRSHPKE